MNWNIVILCVPPAFFLGVIICAGCCVRRDERRKIQEKRHKLKERLAEVHKELELLSALSKQLMPLKEDMDRLRADVAGRHAVVKVSEWPEQHAFGITHCCNFTLDWK